ncbi:hypothetical protein K439DRAFT_1624232 [Ramaria rubella]|nr:hypothetical protein K439DRAFT_1624232 [Ramaria rubella]
MSAQEDLASIIQELSDHVALTYVFVAALALLAYDTVLTFPSELSIGSLQPFPLYRPIDLQFCVTFYICFGDFANNWSERSLMFYVMPSCGNNVFSHLGLLFARAYAISSHKKLVFKMLALLSTIAIVLYMIAIPHENCISFSNIFALCKMFILILRHIVTLYGVFTVLFDTAVFIVIIENTLGLLQLQRRVPGLQRATLSKLLVQQVDTITYRVLTSTLQGILYALQNPLSVILICRFHLDLQQRNDHPNGSNTSHSLPLDSFHAVKERIHRAVVDEFGDLSFNESFGTEGSQEGIELQAMQSPSGVAEIDLQEFPWAGGDIGGEEAGPVASGSGILRG